MTDRIRGLGFGRIAVAMIGVVAMVALATGAVAASGSPFRTAPANHFLVLSDASESAGASATTGASAAASCDPTLDQIEDAAEKSAKAALASGATLAPEGSEPPHCKPVDNDEAGESAKPTKAPAASCDPTLDQKEDAAEKSAKAALAPGATMAPEASEPANCKPADNDNDVDKDPGHRNGPAVPAKGTHDTDRGGHKSGPHSGR